MSQWLRNRSGRQLQQFSCEHSLRGASHAESFFSFLCVAVSRRLRGKKHKDM